MRRKLFQFIGALLLCGLIACSNEDGMDSIGKEKANSQQFNLCGINVENKNGILSFENEDQMKELVNNISGVSAPNPVLKSLSVLTNLTQVAALKKEGFRSLYDVYVEAMSEAENYYEREGGYEEFKAKYSSLFFPEEGDDYSAYLPISNSELAKIADVNGTVIVGGKTISLIDINSYKELEDLGLTPPSENNLRATSGTNSVAEEVVGKNKVWVKCKNTSDKGIPIIQVEVCFRKKNFIGMWYNHNSGTSAKLDAGFGVAEYGGTMIECFGFSSHDYKYARASNGIDKLPVARTVIIKHNGTGRTLTLKLEYPRELL